MDDALRRDVGLALGGLGPIVVAVLLVGVRGSIQNANVALLLVIVVVLAAAVGGRPAGACSAVVSTLSFDFFHTQPYLRLDIASADDVESTVLLLTVGLIVAELAAWARRARMSADRSRGDIRRIHRVADRAAHGDDATQVILAAQDELMELLGLRACRFEAPPFAASLPRLDRAGSLEAHVWRMADDGFELPGALDLPVYGRGQQLGRFVLNSTPGVGVTLERRIVAIAIADQVGAALAAPWTTRKGNGHG